MTAMQGALSAAERSMRSVFVGNIPYEATEEQLKDIFAEVGPVVSFRLVYDRETGKPKGYGFCEYKDQEMALSAMRNLNGYELNGRALRVDNAASEKSKEELKNLQASLGGPPVESPYGPEVLPEKAPEVISKVMCCVPPEQLLELMLQMKQCIENNPNEARSLLLENPQLSYALLQAQAIMGIVDAEIAASLLHKHGTAPLLISGLLPTPEGKSGGGQLSGQQMSPTMTDNQSSFIPGMPQSIPGVSGPRPTNSSISNTRAQAAILPLPRPSLLGDRPQMRANATGMFSDREHTSSDHDLRQSATMEKDIRSSPMLSNDKDMRQSMSDQDMRALSGPSSDQNRAFDPRFRNAPAPDPRAMDPRNADMRPMAGPDMNSRTGFDRGSVRGPQIIDQRTPPLAGNPAMTQSRGIQNPRIGAVASGSPVVGGNSPSSTSSPRPTNSLAAAAAAIAPHDQEKANLIMQVLQLSEQQIAMLPPDQRQSILVLKEQIARSQHQQP